MVKEINSTQIKIRILLASVLFFFSAIGYSQPTFNKIKLFINCQDEEYACFNNYLITELNYFQFVRDRIQSDIEILIIEQVALSYGKKYTLEFNGLNRFANLNLEDTIIIKPAETEHVIRTKILKSIKLNLSWFILKTKDKNDIEVSFRKDTINNIVDTTLTTDKWKNWIFLVGIDGNLNGESNRRGLEQTSYFDVLKVTHKAKFVFDAWYESKLNRVTIDSNRLQATVQNYGVEVYYVHSISGKFSAGCFAGMNHDNFRNINFQYRVAPAVEYNFYDYGENAKRQLRIGYQAGWRHLNYIDTTVFNKLSEIRPVHQLSLVANFARPWGSLSGVLQGTTFIDNFEQNSVTARGSLSIRLAEGLKFYIDGSTSLINNQISLAKKIFPQEKYLLNGAMLPTTFLYSMTVGFIFTFGSTNNSIINTRFENLNE